MDKPLDIPWLKRLETKPEPQPDEDMERVDYEVMLEELEFR